METETEKTEPLGQTPVQTEKDGRAQVQGNKKKPYFTATRIAYMALFTALSYVLYLPFLEFTVFPAVNFMKVDFSNTFVTIAGLSLGPVAGVIVGILKEIMHALTFSQTVGVGELANILIMLPYVLIPSLLYKKFKGIKAVIIMMLGACAAQTLWSAPVNYLLTFPFYISLYTNSPWTAGMQFYTQVWYWALLFNLIKSLLITAAVMLLYKSLSRLIKLTNAGFEKRAAHKEHADPSFRAEGGVTPEANSALPDGGTTQTQDDKSGDE